MMQARISLWRSHVVRCLIIGIAACLCASSLAQDTGQICLQAYVDDNGDGQRAETEGPIARGVAASLLNERGVTISSRLLEDSPFAGDGLLCFDQLLAGEYRVIISSSEYIATSASEAMANVLPGSAPARIDFGAKPMAVTAPPSIINDLAALGDDVLQTLAVIASAGTIAIVVMSLISCLVVITLLRRRNRRKMLQQRGALFGGEPALPAGDSELAPRMTKDPGQGSPPLFSDEDQDW